MVRAYARSAPWRSGRLMLRRVAWRVSLYQLLLLAREHRLVVTEIERVTSLARRRRLESRVIVGQLGKRCERGETHALARQRLATRYAPPPRRKVGGDLALCRRRRDDVHADDRLEHQGRCRRDGLLKRTPAGDHEGDLLGIHRMVLAIQQCHA